MKNYKIVLNSDGGKVTLTVKATDIKHAIDIVSSSELCPEHAIASVTQIK